MSAGRDKVYWSPWRVLVDCKKSFTKARLGREIFLAQTFFLQSTRTQTYMKKAHAAAGDPFYYVHRICRPKF